jgi:hypothetical protein
VRVGAVAKEQIYHIVVFSPHCGTQTFVVIAVGVVAICEQEVGEAVKAAGDCVL